MYIHEAGAKTGLTKKAIAYYCEQGLVSPCVSDNGYREFTHRDVEILRTVSILRRLGMPVRDIKTALQDTTGEALRQFSVQLELQTQADQTKQDILRRVCEGGNDAEIQAALDTLDNSTAISQRILQAFPSYFGQFLCLHFARFLKEPAVTDEQKKAYARIIRFLDTVTLDFPEDLQTLLRESTPDSDIHWIDGMIQETGELLKAPADYLRDHKQALEEYLAYRQSDEYRQSPAFQLQSRMKALMASSGYYEEFIPAMKELSPSYAAYAEQLETANQVFLEQYPDAADRIS